MDWGGLQSLLLSRGASRADVEGEPASWGREEWRVPLDAFRAYRESAGLEFPLPAGHPLLGGPPDGGGALRLLDVRQLPLRGVRFLRFSAE